MHFTITEAWKNSYPGASVGVLAMGNVQNPPAHATLAQRKKELEADLRARFAGYDRAQLRALPILGAYHAYYKRFKKSYHVQLQLESVVFKGKSLPDVAALVEAMFMAELKNQLLTSGHDLDLLQQPVGIDVATGNEMFVGINGRSQQLKKGDMFIADSAGIISTVIYGPDQRTCINPDTQRVLFTVYAPPGVEETAVAQHLADTRDNVLLIAPEATTEQLSVRS